MNCLSRISSYTAAIFGRATHFSAPLWKSTRFDQSGLKTLSLQFFLPTYRVQCCSSQRKDAAKASASLKAKRKKELEAMEEDKDALFVSLKAKKKKELEAMEEEKNAFFVVRKGDVVGVYKSFNDCQAQVGSSICDPPVSVYKGYSLSKETQEYLVSRGLQNALYTIRAADLKEDLFGTLLPCPFQPPTSSKGETLALDVTKKRPQELLGLETVKTDGSTSSSTDPLRKHAKLDNQNEALAPSLLDHQSCTLEFDGASKGNPGPAGAGALLRSNDGRVICRLQEGLGVATNNVAEYRAVILGLKYALKKGYTRICIQGDSKLICSQIQGLWKVKHPSMTPLYEQVKQLKNKFVGFKISHVLREFNSEADALANLAIKLAHGQVQEECE